MSLLAIAALVLAYLCIVAFVIAMLASAKRADADMKTAYRALRRSNAGWGDRRMTEEEPPAEISAHRRAG